MSDNIDQPPQSDVSQGGGAVEFFAGYAGFWKRFAAAILDGFIVNIAVFPVAFVMGMAMGAQGASTEAASSMGQIVGVVVNWLYFTVMEASSKQATLGKMALGIKVTDTDGNPIDFGRANGRYWSKLISLLILGIGFLMAGFTQKKQALHDMIASCLVVNSR